MSVSPLAWILTVVAIIALLVFDYVSMSGARSGPSTTTTAPGSSPT